MNGGKDDIFTLFKKKTKKPTTTKVQTRTFCLRSKTKGQVNRKFIKPFYLSCTCKISWLKECLRNKTSLHYTGSDQ